MKAEVGSVSVVCAVFLAACGGGGGGSGGSGAGGAPSSLTCSGTSYNVGAECKKVYEKILGCCTDKTIAGQMATDVVCGMQAMEAACQAGGSTAADAACAQLAMRPECKGSSGGSDATTGSDQAPDVTTSGETTVSDDHDPFGNCWNLPSQVCTGVSEYFDCLEAKCPTEWNDARIKCKDLAECQMGCACDENFQNCSLMCNNKYQSVDCLNAAMALSKCRDKTDCKVPSCSKR